MPTHEIYIKNRDYYIQNAKKWYRLNIEKKRKYDREYRKKNREKINERQRKYYRKHHAKMLEYYRRKRERKLYGNKTRKEILDSKENKCELCSGIVRLSIHHKDGNPQNNQMENLTVICSACHRQLNKFLVFCKNFPLLYELLKKGKKDYGN